MTRLSSHALLNISHVMTILPLLPQPGMDTSRSRNPIPSRRPRPTDGNPTSTDGALTPMMKPPHPMWGLSRRDGTQLDSMAQQYPIGGNAAPLMGKSGAEGISTRTLLS